MTLYLLLSGTPPFYSRDKNKLREKVLKGKVNFSAKRFSNVSEDAKDLIKMLMAKDPSARPSAIAALKHHWFSKQISEDDSAQFSNFHNFVPRSTPQKIGPFPSEAMRDDEEDTFTSPKSFKSIISSPIENTPPPFLVNSGTQVKKAIDFSIFFQQPEDDLCLDDMDGDSDKEDTPVTLAPVKDSILFKKRNQK